MQFIITIVAVIIVLGFILMALTRLLRPKRLSSYASKRTRKQWKHVETVTDPARKVLEAEKVFDGVLRELGYQGTFADMLRKVGPLLSNEQSVWNAHKLRNRIAHEAGITVSESDARIAVRAFEKAVHLFLV